jgi:hypothetical protein
MTSGPITSEEACGIALEAARFSLFFAILAFRLAVKYSDTTAVKNFVRGWEIFVPGLVLVSVLYCTIAFGM